MTTESFAGSLLWSTLLLVAFGSERLMPISMKAVAMGRRTGLDFLMWGNDYPLEGVFPN